MDEISGKQDHLKMLFKKSRGTIHLKFHDVRMSSIEAVLARGDRRLSGVIRDAFEAGAKFDAWDDLFNFSLWRDSFSKNAIDPQEYLGPKDFADPLSWDFIDAGISRKLLADEAQKALTQR